MGNKCIVPFLHFVQILNLCGEIDGIRNYFRRINDKICMVILYMYSGIGEQYLLSIFKRFFVQYWSTTMWKYALFFIFFIFQRIWHLLFFFLFLHMNDTKGFSCMSKEIENNLNSKLTRSRYSRPCGLYHHFLDKGFLLTRKMLNQGFQVLRFP